MSSTIRLCKDGFWRRKFKTTRRPKPIQTFEIEAPFVTEHKPKCWYCGSPATTKDHQIPYSRGGRGAANKVWACFPCNQAKKAMDVEEYRAYVGMLSNKPVEQIIFFRERNPRALSTHT